MSTAHEEYEQMYVELADLRRQLAAEKERHGNLIDDVERESELCVSQMDWDASVLAIVKELKQQLAAANERTSMAVAMAWREAGDEVKAIETRLLNRFDSKHPNNRRDISFDWLETIHRCILAKLPADTLARLEEREREREELEDALTRIKQWCQAYPLDIFPEPDWKVARSGLESVGITMDAVSASCMRRVTEGVQKIIDAALAASAGKGQG